MFSFLLTLVPHQHSSSTTVVDFSGKILSEGKYVGEPKDNEGGKNKDTGNLRPLAPTANIKHSPNSRQITTNPHTSKAYLLQFLPLNMSGFQQKL